MCRNNDQQTRQNDKVNHPLFKALIQDDKETVEKHLGKKLEDFLTMPTLSKLYKECLRDEEISVLFQKTRSPKECYCRKRCCGLRGPKYVDLPTFLDEVIVSLLKDQRFCFRSRTPEQSKDYSDWCCSCFKPRTSTSPRPADDNQNQNHNTTAADEKVEHAKRELFLWAILFNRLKLARFFWREGQDQLGGALYASALSKKMSSRAHKQDMTELCEQLKVQARNWELLAVNVLNKCYMINSDKARKLLIRRLHHWGPPCDPLMQPSLLNMARSFSMERFTAHTACQTILRDGWMDRLVHNTSRWKIFFCIFLPFLLPIIHFTETLGDKSCTDSCNKTCVGGSAAQDKAEPAEVRIKSVGVCCSNADEISFCSALYYFYSAPVVKFATNMLSYVVFLALISYFSMVQLDEESGWTILQGIIYVWMASMIMEDLRQINVFKQRTLWYQLRHWFRDQWKFELVMYVAFLVFVGLKPLTTGENFKFTRSFFGITVVLAFLSSMQFFFALKAMGPKVIMIQNMLKDLVEYLAIFAIFMTGFGVVYQSLWFPNSSPAWRMLFDVGYYPYYQLYGELFLSHFKGWFSSNLSDPLEGCEPNVTLWIQQGSKHENRCPESNPLLPWMLFVYLALTNLLLANLLIAQFSYTFQKIQDNSINVWRYYRLCIIQEYTYRPTLPPPLIIINHVFRIVAHFSCRYKTDDKDFNALRLNVLPEDQYKALTQLEKDGVDRLDKDGANSLATDSAADPGLSWDTRTQAIVNDVQLMKEKLLQLHSLVSSIHNDDIRRSVEPSTRNSADTMSDA